MILHKGWRQNPIEFELSKDKNGNIMLLLKVRYSEKFLKSRIYNFEGLYQNTDLTIPMNDAAIILFGVRGIKDKDSKYKKYSDVLSKYDLREEYGSISEYSGGRDTGNEGFFYLTSSTPNGRQESTLLRPAGENDPIYNIIVQYNS